MEAMVRDVTDAFEEALAQHHQPPAISEATARCLAREHGVTVAQAVAWLNARHNGARHIGIFSFSPSETRELWAARARYGPEPSSATCRRVAGRTGLRVAQVRHFFIAYRSVGRNDGPEPATYDEEDVAQAFLDHGDGDGDGGRAHDARGPVFRFNATHFTPQVFPVASAYDSFSAGGGGGGQRSLLPSQLPQPPPQPSALSMDPFLDLCEPPPSGYLLSSSGAGVVDAGHLTESLPHYHSSPLLHGEDLNMTFSTNMWRSSNNDQHHDNLDYPRISEEFATRNLETLPDEWWKDPRERSQKPRTPSLHDGPWSWDGDEQSRRRKRESASSRITYTTFSDLHRRQLLNYYERNPEPTQRQCRRLAERLKLRPEAVSLWFRNKKVKSAAGRASVDRRDDGVAKRASKSPGKRSQDSQEVKKEEGGGDGGGEVVKTGRIPKGLKANDNDRDGVDLAHAMKRIKTEQEDNDSSRPLITAITASNVSKINEEEEAKKKKSVVVDDNVRAGELTQEETKQGKVDSNLKAKTCKVEIVVKTTTASSSSSTATPNVLKANNEEVEKCDGGKDVSGGNLAQETKQQQDTQVISREVRKVVISRKTPVTPPISSNASKSDEDGKRAVQVETRGAKRVLSANDRDASVVSKVAKTATPRASQLTDEHRAELKRQFAADPIPSLEACRTLAESMNVKAWLVVNWFDDRRKAMEVKIRKKVVAAESSNRSTRPDGGDDDDDNDESKQSLPKQVREELMRQFDKDPNPSTDTCRALAERLNIETWEVVIWFVDRRKMASRRRGSKAASVSSSTPRLTEEHLAELKRHFATEPSPSVDRCRLLAERMKLKPWQVVSWFDDRRNAKQVEARKKAVVDKQASAADQKVDSVDKSSKSTGIKEHASSKSNTDGSKMQSKIDQSPKASKAVKDGSNVMQDASVSGSATMSSKVVKTSVATLTSKCDNPRKLSEDNEKKKKQEKSSSTTVSKTLITAKTAVPTSKTTKASMDSSKSETDGKVDQTDGKQDKESSLPQTSKVTKTSVPSSSPTSTGVQASTDRSNGDKDAKVDQAKVDAKQEKKESSSAKVSNVTTAVVPAPASTGVKVNTDDQCKVSDGKQVRECILTTTSVSSSTSKVDKTNTDTVHCANSGDNKESSSAKTVLPTSPKSTAHQSNCDKVHGNGASVDTGAAVPTPETKTNSNEESRIVDTHGKVSAEKQETTTVLLPTSTLKINSDDKTKQVDKRNEQVILIQAIEQARMKCSEEKSSAKMMMMMSNPVIPELTEEHQAALMKHLEEPSVSTCRRLAEQIQLQPGQVANWFAAENRKVWETERKTVEATACKQPLCERNDDTVKWGSNQFTVYHRTQLMQHFAKDPYPSVGTVRSLAMRLGLDCPRVGQWFHNKAKAQRKQKAKCSGSSKVVTMAPTSVARPQLTNHQVVELEKHFTQESIPSRDTCIALAARLQLLPNRVMDWFVLRRRIDEMSSEDGSCATHLPMVDKTAKWVDSDGKQGSAQEQAQNNSIDSVVMKAQSSDHQPSASTQANAKDGGGGEAVDDEEEFEVVDQIVDMPPPPPVAQSLHQPEESSSSLQLDRSDNILTTKIVELKTNGQLNKDISSISTTTTTSTNKPNTSSSSSSSSNTHTQASISSFSFTTLFTPLATCLDQCLSTLAEYRGIEDRLEEVVRMQRQMQLDLAKIQQYILAQQKQPPPKHTHTHEHKRETHTQEQ